MTSVTLRLISMEGYLYLQDLYLKARSEKYCIADSDKKKIYSKLPLNRQMMISRCT